MQYIAQKQTVNYPLIIRAKEIFMSEIKYCKIHHNDPLASPEKFSQAEAEKAKAFHSTFDEYCVTPLAKLTNLAAVLGVKDFYVKDESYRFGLNAFKALGGTYCVGKCVKESKREKTILLQK